MRILNRINNILMSGKAKDILENYKKVDKEKEDKIKKVVEEYSSQSETEEEESKYYAKFAEQGTEAIKTMTGFYISEFLELYSHVENILNNKEEEKDQK